MADLVNYIAARKHATHGRLSLALECIRKFLTVRPDDRDGMSLQAAILTAMGRHREALEIFRAVDSSGEPSPSVLSNMGNALGALGDQEGAVENYSKALTLDRDYVPALIGRAAQRLAIGRSQDALDDAVRAAGLKPELAAPHRQMSLALTQLGNLEEALAAINRALEIDELNAESHQRRAKLLFHMRRFGESLAAADRSFALMPSAEAQVQRGKALLQTQDKAAALAAFDAAITLDPNAYDTHISRGVTLNYLGRYREAIAGFENAMAVDSRRALAYFRRAQGRLRLGDFAAGWADYERRWDADNFLWISAGFVTPPLRERLDPGLTRDDLKGRSVLLAGEQGVGDQIMFASMIPDLLPEAGPVTLACDRRLHGLFGASLPALNLLPAPPDPKSFDRVLAMGSLGRLYRNAAADFPGTPYLAPRQAVTAAWGDRLGSQQGRFRVGISWRGGTDYTDGALRSVPLADLEPLLCLPDCEFVSLQYGDSAAEVEAMNARLPRSVRLFPPDAIDDFEQLAGLVCSLDLVVSVQTTLIHLCGAIGAPAMVMVPFMPEWRYGIESASMLWYRGVRLERQGSPSDWRSVIEAVTAAVRERSFAARIGI